MKHETWLRPNDRLPWPTRLLCLCHKYTPPLLLFGVLGNLMFWFFLTADMPVQSFTPRWDISPRFLILIFFGTVGATGTIGVIGKLIYTALTLAGGRLDEQEARDSSSPFI